MPRNPNSRSVRSRIAGAPNRSKKLSVCDRPSKMIEETPNATSVTSAADQPGSSRPLPNERRWTRPSSSTRRQWARRPSRRNQTVNVSPCERHSSRPNWAIIASVQRRVADEDDEQRRGAGEDHELEPDEEREPDRRRPAAEPLRVVGDRPALDAEPAQDRGAEVVERRERIEEVPGRSDDRADDRQPDPAVDPQEERRDVGVARVAGDALGDDPDPAEEADGPERVADPRRRQRALGRRGRAVPPARRGRSRR